MSLILMVVMVMCCAIHSEKIVCNSPGECANKEYYCNSGSDNCIIICSANNACGGSSFTCNPSQKCNITCATVDGSACEKTHFIVYDESKLLFTGQNNQFLYGYLTCGHNSKCNVQCGVVNNALGNDGMCKSSIIDASQASRLKIIALGQETLRYAQIYCPEKGDCIIDLVGSDTGAYKISNVDIFIDEPSNVNLKIICDESSSCYGDVGNAPILYCYNKLYNCVYETRNGRDWFCREKSPCDYNWTFVPTNQPTNEPTKAPNNPSPASKNGNAGAIAVVIVLILICCVITAFFVWKWHDKRIHGAYEGLLQND